MAIKTSDVRDSLVFFLSTTILLTVDSEYFVCRRKEGGLVRERIGGTGADEGKELVVYQENIPRGDLYILNPYAEGLGDRTPPSTFFYNRLTLGLTTRVRMLISAALKLALADKGIEVGADLGLDTVPHSRHLLDMLSGKTDGRKPIVDEIDEKMYGEIETLLGTKKMQENICSPEYRKNQAHSVLSAPILRDNVEEIPGIRKKTVLVLKAILANILNIHKPADFDVYTAKAVKNTPAKMSSWMQVLYSIYERINPALEDVFPDLLVEMGTFRGHLENMPAYYGNAYCMVVSNAPQATAAVPQATSNGVPVQHVPQAQHVPQPGAGVPQNANTQSDPNSVFIPGVGMVPVPQSHQQMPTPQQQQQMQMQLLQQQYAQHMPPPVAPQQGVSYGYAQPQQQQPYYPQQQQQNLGYGGYGFAPPPQPVFNPLVGGYVQQGAGGFPASMTTVGGMPMGYR